MEERSESACVELLDVREKCKVRIFELVDNHTEVAVLLGFV